MPPAGDGTAAVATSPPSPKVAAEPVLPPAAAEDDLKKPAKVSDAADLPPSKPRRSCVALSVALIFVILLFYLSIFSLLWVYFFAAPQTVSVSTATTGEIARFAPACTSTACPVLGEGFFFGYATAPAHVEDQLEDGWLDFARYGHMKYNRTDTNTTYQSAVGSGEAVKAWSNTAVPEERLRFWTDYETEMALARNGGSDAIRLGVDWGRLVPVEPINGTSLVVDWAAVEHYRQMIRTAKENFGMRVMLTLFHHSFPKWGMQWGGWTVAEKAVPYFTQLAELAVSEFGPHVDYWCTFNEPSIFALLSYCVGVWPPGFAPDPLHTATCFTPMVGLYSRAMRNIATAHNAAYDVIRAKSKAPIGVAHNTGFMVPYSAIDLIAHEYFNKMTLFAWTDQIVGHLDYMGLNYYSQEVLSVAGLQAVPDEEYSENGRAVYPDGLFRILTMFHDRYKTQYPSLRYIITENGIADDPDVVRGPYLLEHLLAINAAIQQGVPVDGYFHWTISDNWEWADGYCPKFGTVKVDRANNLTRLPRPSYYLYKQISETRVITAELRNEQWNALQEKVQAGVKRPFCRDVDSMGRMGSDTLNVPIERPLSTKDWRFGHYVQPSLYTMYQRTGHVFNCWSRDLMTVSGLN